MYVADAHALAWYFTNDARLGVCRRNAKRTDSQCDFFHFGDHFGNFTHVPKKKALFSGLRIPLSKVNANSPTDS